MTFHDINQIRKEGRLEEARERAMAWLQEEPQERWARKAMAWVIHDELKRLLGAWDRRKAFDALLAELRGLDLESDDQVLWERCGWILADWLAKTAILQEGVGVSDIAPYLEWWAAVPSPRPRAADRALMRAILPLAGKVSGWETLLRYWDLAGLDEDDYQMQEKDGKRYMSLAERVYTALGKSLARRLEEYVREGMDPAESPVWQALSEKWLGELEAKQEEQKDWVWVRYCLVKIYRSLGRVEEAKPLAIPLVKQKSRDFWVWHMMASLEEEGTERQRAFLAKALLCGAKPEFLVRVREEMAACLIRAENYAGAKAEISHLAATRKQQGWSLPPRVKKWMDASWYAGAQPEAAQPYASWAGMADEWLMEDLPLRVGVVYDVDQRGTSGWVVVEEGIFCRVLMEGLGEGQLVEMRMEFVDKRWRVRQARLAADQKQEHPMRRIYVGKAVRKPDWEHAFVGDAFVPPVLAKDLVHGQEVGVAAVWSYHRAKEKWGWKVVRWKAVEELRR